MALCRLFSPSWLVVLSYLWLRVACAPQPAAGRAARGAAAPAAGGHGGGARSGRAGPRRAQLGRQGLRAERGLPGGGLGLGIRRGCLESPPERPHLARGALHPQNIPSAQVTSDIVLALKRITCIIAVPERDMLLNRVLEVVPHSRMHPFDLCDTLAAAGVEGVCYRGGAGAEATAPTERGSAQDGQRGRRRGGKRWGRPQAGLPRALPAWHHEGSRLAGAPLAAHHGYLRL